MHRTSAFARRLALALCLVLPGLATANMGSASNDTSTDPAFVEGRAAIEAQDWAVAEAAMRRALGKDAGNADAHNWLGFALRKQGRFEESFAAYREALRLNPQHRSALEYLGEAFLMTKQLGKAEEQLAALARLCSPIPCEEHKELARAIDAYKKKNK